jgi:Uma2 family endonuclease
MFGAQLPVPILLPQSAFVVIEWCARYCVAINIDEKPYYEIIAGELVVKYGPMTPQRTHQALTMRMTEMLRAWVGNRGEVLPDWRFRMPSDEARESYIPDVSVLFNESAAPFSDEELEKPRLAPDVAVEVRSPDDKPARLAYKIATMLANGTRVVIEVDPKTRAVRAHARDGVTKFFDGDVFSHPALEEFVFDVGKLFDSTKRRQS